MADSHSEKETFGRSAKYQHKYGTASRTSSTTTYPEHYIRHSVQKDDTLPGIALKYGCSMQQLKTVNGIHCDWQFASRNIIYVPVSFIDGYVSNNPAAELVTRQEMLNSQKMTRTASDSKIAKDEINVDSGNVKDYFSKYDSSLAEIKGSMDRLTQSINARTDSDNPLLMLPSKKTSRQSRGVWNADVESLDPSREPELRFMSQSVTDCSPINGSSTAGNARTVRLHRLPPESTWQQMEQTHDELFQL